MHKKIIFLILALVLGLGIYANTLEVKQKTDTNIVGDVKDKRTGEHMPFITIMLKGTTIGTTTDATGHYFLKDLPLGEFVLEARFLGYKTQEKKLILEKGKTYEINFDLEEDNFALNEVVVSANRNETTRKTAPTLVNILNTQTFARTHSVSLSDGLNFQPGLRVEDNCQNCGFTQVRMNGLDGAYSQILLDSRPIFSALAGVYGLEQIPANMVERVEVVRGGGSALFGASAIAGTINIITKEPTRNTGEISHSLMSIGGKSSFDNSTAMNASIVSDNQRMGLMVFGQKRHRSAYDKDGDGFSELPVLDGRTIGFRSFIKTGLYSKFTFEYHNINEFRRGGDLLHKQPFEAYVAEQVESNVDVGSIKYDWTSSDLKHSVSAYGSGQLVKRDSYYGGGDPVDTISANSTPEEILNYNHRMSSFGKTSDKTYALGAQYIYKMDKLWFMPSDLTVGVEHVEDRLSDRSGYRKESVKQKTRTESVYLQNEWKNDRWGILIGGRLDDHNLVDKPIISPRANFRYNPTSDINLRLSYGQGFRAPQLFDEDLHVDIAGGDHIISERDPNLKEEKSHSLSASMDWYTRVGATELNFMVESFYTRLLDPFASVTEEKNNGTIIKTTVNESGAKVYGFNLEARMAYSDLLDVQMGATIQKSRFDDARKWSDDEDDNVEATKKMMRTPDVYGYFVATVTPVKRFSTSLSGNYTGRMLVPHESYVTLDNVEMPNSTKRTRTFFTLNLKASYDFSLYKGTELELSAGMQNIFNAYQKDFDKGPGRASSYIYGPSLPRSYFASAKITF